MRDMLHWTTDNLFGLNASEWINDIHIVAVAVGVAIYICGPCIIYCMFRGESIFFHSE